MYVILITEDSADFIAKYFSDDGLAPKIEDGKSYFVIGDDNRPNEILSVNDFVSRYGPGFASSMSIFKK